ncbi:MAG: hypothetical protein JXB49_22035 [Bacteroidales bacterium]|nr:hypothetical protein [Bacteroidales bacterium]
MAKKDNESSKSKDIKDYRDSVKGQWIPKTSSDKKSKGAVKESEKKNDGTDHTGPRDSAE